MPLEKDKSYTLLTEIRETDLNVGLFADSQETLPIVFEDGNNELGTALIRIHTVQRIAEGLGKFRVVADSIEPPDKIVEIEVDPLQPDGWYGKICLKDPIQ